MDVSVLLSNVNILVPLRTFTGPIIYHSYIFHTCYLKNDPLYRIMKLVNENPYSLFDNINKLILIYYYYYYFYIYLLKF